MLIAPYFPDIGPVHSEIDDFREYSDLRSHPIYEDSLNSPIEEIVINDPELIAYSESFPETWDSEF